MSVRTRRIVLVAAALLLLGTLHLGMARLGPGFAELLAWLGGSLDARGSYVFEQIRLPRLVVAMCGGAALAMAGAMMQATLRNPLASPDFVGTAAGAAFGGRWRSCSASPSGRCWPRRRCRCSAPCW